MLVGLYEEPERPNNAVDYIKRYMGAPTGIDVRFEPFLPYIEDELGAQVEALRQENEELRKEREELRNTINDLNARVATPDKAED